MCACVIGREINKETQRERKRPRGGGGDIRGKEIKRSVYVLVMGVKDKLSNSEG